MYYAMLKKRLTFVLSTACAPYFLYCYCFYFANRNQSSSFFTHQFFMICFAPFFCFLFLYYHLMNCSNRIHFIFLLQSRSFTAFRRYLRRAVFSEYFSERRLCFDSHRLGRVFVIHAHRRSFLYRFC